MGKGRALVTGSAGQVGRAVRDRLEELGCVVVPFDVADGRDVRDLDAVVEAADGCDAIVHAAAIAHDTSGTPAEIVDVNVRGTWHVLLAAEQHAVERVVCFSSGQVFGFAEGEGSPDHLPVADDHPLRAARPYGMSKRLVEEVCEAWTSRTGIPTVVLRPVLILNDHTLAAVEPSALELGAFVHLDDVVEATLLSLAAPLSGHHRLLLCGPGEFDTSAARTVLGWHPTRGFPR